MNTQINPDWKQIFENYKASGLSVREFAMTHEIKYHTLRYHLSKQRQANPVEQKIPDARIVPLPMPTSNGLHRSTAGSEIKITVEAGVVTIRIGGL